MAYNRDQTDPTIPVSGSAEKTSAGFLPKYFRTTANQKFLNATMDQMISEGQVEKISAFIGRTNTEPYQTTDKYLEGATQQRADYQFEPAVIIKDDLDNVTFFKDYPDYINQLAFFNSGDTNHNKINSQEFYAWNPHFDWDKFVNYRDYYWLPVGPQSIPVAGQSDNITSTYTVSIVDDVDNRAYVFSPDGLTRNPYLRLYRGQTYRFDIDTPEYGMAFKTVRETGDSYFYTTGVSTGNEYVEKGVIEFTVPLDAPNIIYYVSKNDVSTGGVLTIYDISDATSIDVEQELIGKKTYTTSNGIVLSNGMKIYFQGRVTPEKYATGNWYVEGVGTAIKLVKETDLATPSLYSTDANIEFDNENFDTQGFDVSNDLPANKDYLVINRASKDSNPWTRYNRWFHRKVIELSATINNQEAILDQSSRATRPIIEFEADLKLWNMGRQFKTSVTLVDTYTRDVFSTIEGSLGYNIDGVDLIEGMRVLFTADPDVQVNGRIFKVKYLTHLGVRRLTLIEEEDTTPLADQTVLVLTGAENKGKMFYYDGDSLSWKTAQLKTKVNQAPLFDIFDSAGISYGNDITYPGTTFAGTRLFGYTPGTSIDSALGFGIAYKNIGNIGDILFNFDLDRDTFIYKSLAEIKTVEVAKGYLKKTVGLDSFSYVNGWETAVDLSKQYVVQQIDTEVTSNYFEITSYKSPANLTDLEVKVYRNGAPQSPLTDFSIFTKNDRAFVETTTDVPAGSTVIIKTHTASQKNTNGYYEIPANLESNPANLNLNNCTLGEIINHVKSIADSRLDFDGTVPGTGNLRDLGNLTAYGKKIVQHSAPLTPVIYHFTDKNHNVVKSLRYAKDEYNKFKRNFIRVATDYGYDGITRVHLDLLLKELVKDRTKTMPFYFSDMVPFGGSFEFVQEIIDNSITDYPLTFNFNLDTLSDSAVLVYINDRLLKHGTEYTFINDNFVSISATINEGDELRIVQYDNTHGCYIPPTPTKLGLYPLYEPKIYTDDTLVTPVKVIQGHDGSIVRAFEDFRDDLILELELRIYNNIKVKYDPKLFDLTNFVSGYYRTANISKEQLDNTLRQDFLKWSRFISEDYTKHTFFEGQDSFTFNYKNFSAINGTPIPGFWRAIYKQFYDTDRPHSHPWEILGFSEQPTWWTEVYGPAPYTRDNLVLWSDIAEGIIREPGKLIQRVAKYARPTILNHIPSDDNGNLLSPLESNCVRDYVYYLAEAEFTFGDEAPIETAWRRSSEFPFALITAITILRPAQSFATIFDRARQVRDSAGQIVYNTANGPERFSHKNIEFPNSISDTARVYTSGLINYISDFALSQSQDSLASYKERVPKLQINLSHKVGGFITKEKYKLILDSRSPSNKGNVFVPFENYKVILNTSTPVVSIDYSAVIVEKQPSGFVIRGYNPVTPEFNYYKPREIANDPVLNVGGISEAVVDWNRERFYNKTQVVKNDNNYYRVTVSHTSGPNFELKYFAKLPALPVEGGRQVIVRTAFEEIESTLHYGAEIKTIQGVVDFLLGYGQWLVAQGFDFQYFNPTLLTVTDWQTAVKEFAFWTTQNWKAGAVISLSPGADEVKFNKEFSVVDNIYDSFYEYSIYKQDGTPLDALNINTVRKGSNFSLRPKNTDDGIYHATLNLVQKEHVVILDNSTVFNDVIYDQIQGYRQDRIKVVGYRTSGWQGDFNIPGFVYDRAEVTVWTPWKDYALGDTVKYKEFYYSARTNVPGTENFEYDSWFKLSEKPESKLIPNWDYKANQFFDFYDLDTDSFDVDQQKVAQHLIGYQRRPYLENIINDDVAQYKFYQGMIRDKGTKNVLSKLFDPLSSADKDSLEFYEEWAIRLGSYGATAAFEEVEYIIDESKMLINPQPFELVSSINSESNDFVYRILPHEVYVPSTDYNHAPFPEKSTDDYFVETSGHVRLSDVDFLVNTKDDLATLDFSLLRNGSRIWVGYVKNTWGMYRFSALTSTVDTMAFNADDDAFIRITFAGNRDSELEVGEYIAINATDVVSGIRKITSVGYNYIEFAAGDLTEDDLLLATVENAFVLYKFSSLRSETINDLNSINLPNKNPGELVWIDGVNNDWSVWEYNKTYSATRVIEQTAKFGSTIAVNDLDNVMVVASDDLVAYFSRPASTFRWTFAETILAPRPETNGSFGKAIAMSRTGDVMLIGAPAAESGAGYISLYNINNAKIYQYISTITPAVRVNNEQFGYRIGFTANHAVIASRGTTGTVASKIYLYSLTGTLLDTVTFDTVSQIADLSTGDNLIAVSFTDESVRIYSTADGSFTEVAVLSYSDISPSTTFDITTGSNFAESVAISRDGSTVAVGAPLYSGQGVSQGCVLVYELSNGNYIPQYTVTSPTKQESGFFGKSISFNNAGDQLVVYGSGLSQLERSTFDVYSEKLYPTSTDDGLKYINDPSSALQQTPTTFDLGNTTFATREKYVGSVIVFDKYDTQFVYAEELDITGNFGNTYGAAVYVTNRVYIGDPARTSGGVYDFSSSTKSWKKIHQPDAPVDVTKIKSIFLYDTEANKIIQNLDFIDPLQGKILGLAEQELSYKTHYDPATYVIGTESVSIDELSDWGSKQVGRLWWDLSSAKFINTYQGSVVYKSNSWNNRFNDNEVDILEWVESKYTPAEWDALADTEEGLTEGISGQSKYGNMAYCITQTYDVISEKVSNKYYFWVKNKTVVPNAAGRKYSAKDVSTLISDPKSQGIKYVALHSSNQFSLVNCKDLIADRRVAINFRYWTIDNTETNVHSHYQLISEGDSTKQLNKYVEKKWLESLIGFDELGNPVPDPKLPMKLKYGILSKPRQSMFINRLEALKQFVERVNTVLLANNIIDDVDITKLYETDREPSVYTHKYDIVKTTYSELRFVNVASATTATLTPVVENGRIIRVTIDSKGKSYADLSYDASLGKPRRGPYVQISGIGTGAKLSTIINTAGEIIDVVVDKPGSGYQPNTQLTVRPFTVLVTADENSGGKWALYKWNISTQTWIKDLVQTYDVSKYWRFADWYADGYNAFTKLDYAVDFSYELASLTMDIGDVVKVKNVGSSGWLLMEKNSDSINLLDINSSFKVIGRQNGTIQLNSNIYKFKNSNIGYDGPFYDVDVFDDEPKEELRIIIDVLKNNIFIDQLADEYKSLFFASLRYVFTEQVFVDWAFKTSFVKSKHNLGELKQTITYQNDNLENYEDYINEVKPYRTKIREFISAYEKLEQTKTGVTDFDLPSVFNPDTGAITPIGTQVVNGVLIVDNNVALTEPYSNWYYNVGHSIKSIDVRDGGSGYKSAPQVLITGTSNLPAKATAYISRGKIIKIVVDEPGQGFLVTPTITLDGGLDVGGVPAQTSIQLERGPVRSNKVGIKFDRLSSSYELSTLDVAQQFDGTGSRTRFDLKWPADLRPSTYSVTINGIDALDSDFTVVNVKDTTSEFERYTARVTFVTAPSSLSIVKISYKKNISLLSAADRIKYYYNPGTGQVGKDLGQLMTGVDYGGVEVKGLSFEIGSGWDALPWFTGGWDTFDTNFKDLLIVSDGVSRGIDIKYIPVPNVEINVYKNGTKIDDPNYDSVNAQQLIVDAEQLALDALNAQLQSLTTIKVDAQTDKNNALATAQQEYAELVVLQDAYNQALLDNDMILALQIQQQVINQGVVVNAANTAYSASIIAYDLASDNVDAKQSEVDAQEVVLAQETVILEALDPIINENAIMNTLYGDGSTQVFTIPVQVPLADGDKIILRESTSDGSFRPDDQTIDVDLQGGDLAYTSARGVNPEAINIDGDGFVTVNSSHAPEEVVPGQVVDTVDIQVFDKVSDGSPVIVSRFYKVNGELEFAIGQNPSSLESIFVKINGEIKKADVDYIVDFRAQTIKPLTILAVGDEITIFSMSQNGTGILDLDSFVADGTTTDYVTAARWAGDFSAFVTVDGVSESVTTFIADSTFAAEGSIVIRFGNAPAQGSIINYTIITSFVNSISNVKKETIVHDGVTSTYALQYPPLVSEPLENNLIVIANGKVVKSPDNYYFDVVGASRTFAVGSADYAFNSIDPDQVRVYVNGVEILQSKDWNWLSNNNELKLKRNAAQSGDKVALSIFKDASYTVVGSNITFLVDYPADTEITITSFSNHDILDVQRSNDTVTFDASLTPGLVDYLKFTQLTSGRIQLPTQTIAPQYVWITVNQELLTPDVDYILEDNLRYVRIENELQSTDVVEIIVFNSKTVRSAFGYRIFKDMTNAVSYKRFDDSSSTKLAQPLNGFDPKITVVDASLLTEPDSLKNEPGVVYIDKERIEYLKKTGNVLSQLRRGTLGTGIKNQYPIGTRVRDQSTLNTIPYRDEVSTQEVVSDGFSTASTVYPNSPSVTVTSLKYNFNNNTAFPLGGQVATVKGTGFRDNVKVYVGSTECPTTYVSETELTFITPGKSVGSYDLVIYNPAKTVPFAVPATSRVVPLAIKYVQILLPFAPLPNPRSATNWYKETEVISASAMQVGRGYKINTFGTTDFTQLGASSNSIGTEFIATAAGTGTGTVLNYTSIPAEYWESMDIEVFVGGRRLRKTPIAIYDETLGPDSVTGNRMLQAEFAVNKNVGAYVRLTEAPDPGVKIIVQKRIGRSWTSPGVDLTNATSDQAKFIRAKGVDLSE